MDDNSKKYQKPKEKWFINKLTDILKSIPKKSLKPGVRAYLIAIASFADKEGNAWPTAKQISNISGQSDKHQFRYDRILKSKKILTIKKRYDRKNHMNRKHFKIDIQAVLNISIDEEGGLKIGEIEVKNIRSEIEQLSKMEKDQLSKMENTTIKTTQETKLPIPINYKGHCDRFLDRFKEDKIEEIKHDNWFEQFWSIYPRKEKKTEAKNIWKRERLDRVAAKIIMDVRDRQLRHDRWEDMTYIPQASSYLLNESWNDEIIDRRKLHESTETNNNLSRKSKRESAIIDGFREYEKSRGK
jgi:hypothetical protein